MGLSLVDVVGDLHHDHSEGHRQAGHAAEEGDGAEQGERAGVHPRPVLVRLRTARVNVILKIISQLSPHPTPTIDPSKSLGLAVGNKMT